jgi:hypothetical protein
LDSIWLENEVCTHLERWKMLQQLLRQVFPIQEAAILGICETAELQKVEIYLVTLLNQFPKD